MNPEARQVLAGYLLGLADDEMILAHRNSEWAGHAPILEEDIAFANIALDEMGHAALWYRLVAELREQEPEGYADQMVFAREASEFRNVQMVELPIGDWAFSILRQYLFDSAEIVRLDALRESEQASAVATKIRVEEIYHLRHSQAWTHRLGLGTEESNRRMQRALDELLPLALQLFEHTAEEMELEQSGQLPNAGALQSIWLEQVGAHLERSNLELPQLPQTGGLPRGVHSEHLEPLVHEMQEVARAEQEAAW